MRSALRRDGNATQSSLGSLDGRSAARFGPSCPTLNPRIRSKRYVTTRFRQLRDIATGGQGVAGSNPVSPTVKTLVDDHKSSARVLCFSERTPYGHLTGRILLDLKTGHPRLHHCRQPLQAVVTTRVLRNDGVRPRQAVRREAKDRLTIAAQNAKKRPAWAAVCGLAGRSSLSRVTPQNSLRAVTVQPTRERRPVGL